MDKQVASIPKEILRRYEKWKDVARLSGPPGLRLIKGFRAEALRGKWHGYRSSRLGDQWRVIYRAVTKEMLFQVASITAHDYRTK
jgi:addiction module RelE/StbE family toxin